jgi:hypothetical protein
MTGPIKEAGGGRLHLGMSFWPRWVDPATGGTVTQTPIIILHQSLHAHNTMRGV